MLTSVAKLFLGSYMVRIIPLTHKPSLLLVFIVSMVVINSLRPCNAKNSHWTGIITPEEAHNALTVKMFNDGGQSLII